MLTLRANLAPARHPRGTEARTFDAMLARIAELPGVRSAAVTSAVPLANDYDHVGIDLYGERLREGADKLDAERFIVGGDYFRSLGIPLRAGRLFEPTDDAGHARVAIVDETFAREIAPGGSALGVRLSWGDSIPATVVGIVAHVRHNGPDTPSGGQIYMPHQQSPWRWMSVVVRAADGVRPTSLVPAVRGAIQSIDREQPVFGVTTLDALLAEHTAPRRFMLALLGAFAVVAVLLAAVGLYGVMAYAVVQRRRELGVRLSLGATPGHVRRLVVGRGLLLAGYGGLLGVAASIGGARLLGGILFGVRPADATVLAGVTLLLFVVAAVASYAPARRATRADPAIVLRGD
jgi:putative ABC transport system permease protein